MHLLVMGDSIAQGLGVAGRSYADVLGGLLSRDGDGCRVSNWAGSAAQIHRSAERLPEIVALQPDIVVVAHGITEALVRPTPSALAFVPRRWRPAGWMDPRPYYSRRWGKRLYQQCESAVRWRVKNRLIRARGGATLMGAAEFEGHLTDTTEALRRRTSARIVLLTHCGVDERFYPGSPASLDHYKEAAARVALRAGDPIRVRVCDVSRLLARWSDYFLDHFHPNASGHAKIAWRLYEDVARHFDAEPTASENR